MLLKALRTKWFYPQTSCRNRRTYRKGKDPLNEFYGDNLVWLHLKTTGLNEKEDLILEVASCITTRELFIVAETGNIYVKHNENTIENLSNEQKIQIEKVRIKQIIFNK